MMNKFQKYATIVAFVALIFGPSVAWMFCSGAMGEDDSENRKLAEMPAFDISQIEKYPEQFDKFYDDHTPFRKMAKDVWTEINYKVFGDSTTEDVTIGKNNGKDASEAWLFYSETDDNSPVRGVQGLMEEYPDSTLKRVSSNIKETTEQLEKRGKKYYFFVAPNKENIYREYLPDSVGIFDDKSREEKLIDKLKIDNENVIYAKEEVMKAKEIGQLYYKHDTHWNDLGAFYGFKALMQKIEPEFKNFEYELKFSEPHADNRDLARFLGIRNYFVDADAIVEYRKDSVVKVDVEEKDGKKTKIATNNNPAINKTVMIIGDSYSWAMVPYLQKTFHKVVNMERDVYKKSFIDRYDPDIIVVEAVERYTVVGGNLKLF